MSSFHLATISSPTVKIYEISSAQKLSVLYNSDDDGSIGTLHNVHFADSCWSPNGSELVNICCEGNVFATSINPASSSSTHKQDISKNGNQRWKLRSGSRILTDAVSVTCSHRSSTAAIGSSNGAVHIVNLATLKEAYRFKHCQWKINAVRFLANDSYLCAATEDGKIAVANCTMNFQLSAFLNDDMQAVQALDCSLQTSSLIGSGSDDGGVRLWDVVRCQRVRYFEDAHNGVPCTGFSFIPVNDKLAVSVGLDRYIVFYDITSKNIVSRLAMKNALSCVAFGPTAGMLVVGTTEGDVIVYDVTAAKTFMEIHSGNDAIKRVACSNTSISQANNPKSRKGMNSQLRDSHRSNEIINDKMTAEDSSTMEKCIMIENVPHYYVSSKTYTDVPSNYSGLGCFSPIASSSKSTGANSSKSTTLDTIPEANTPLLPYVKTQSYNGVANITSRSAFSDLQQHPEKSSNNVMDESLEKGVFSPLANDQIRPLSTEEFYTNSVSLTSFDAKDQVHPVTDKASFISLFDKSKLNNRTSTLGRRNGTSCALDSTEGILQTLPAFEDYSFAPPVTEQLVEENTVEVKRQSLVALDSVSENIRSVVAECLEEYDEQWRATIWSLYAAIIGQNCSMEQRVEKLIQSHQTLTVKNLIKENQRLKSENDRLKAMLFERNLRSGNTQ